MYQWFCDRGLEERSGKIDRKFDRLEFWFVTKDPRNDPEPLDEPKSEHDEKVYVKPFDRLKVEAERGPYKYHGNEAEEAARK